MTTVATPTGIILLVNGGQLTHHVSLHDALRLLYLKKVEIVEAETDVFVRSANGSMWPMPKILRLIRFVKLAYDKINGAPQISKRGVLTRDHYTCAYCGGHGNTVDHVQPRSKGGRSSWVNLVAACRDCNNRKRDRTPEEAGMKLRVTPYAPKKKTLSVPVYAFAS